MKKKRGNPNWGKPDLHPTARIQANSFEEIVRKLRLLPEQYVNSVRCAIVSCCVGWKLMFFVPLAMALILTLLSRTQTPAPAD